MPYIIAYVDIIYFYFPICYNSEWGYYRDKNSGNCVLDPNCGPELDCLTGYVIVCNVVQCIAMHALYNHESIIEDPWHCYNSKLYYVNGLTNNTKHHITYVSQVAQLLQAHNNITLAILYNLLNI